MAASRDELLESIAEQIADYREGEVPRPTPDHVERWIGQFPDDVQDAMLAELHHVFNKTYFSRKNFDSFLRSLAKNKKFAGDDPASFWSNAHLLDVQQGGSSQREMLAMFREGRVTDAQGEVMVQLKFNGRSVVGRGAHPDVLVASAKAYINALNRLEWLSKDVRKVIPTEG